MNIYTKGIKSFFLIILALCPSLVPAQVDSTKKFPSLLWEISGNGLSQNSYLYGTMHVSSKVAFHLGDSFFHAISSVDKVALESDPTQWLDQMLDSAYLEESGSLHRSGKYYRDFYDEAFFIDFLDRKSLGGTLNFNNGIINGMLYRNNSYNTEFEEDTYLDMYIFQTARKWGKEILGLEDFLVSSRLVKKSQEPHDDEDDDELKKPYQKLVRQGKRPMEMLEDAYRNGDLDMVDSIQKIISPGINHQRYMLHERNRIMANNIDSIIKNGSNLFSGVGAAHLAGDSGMIMMLRQMGYQVRPIMRSIGDESRAFRNKLEKAYVPQKLEKYVSSDSWFEVQLPGAFHEFPVNRQYKLYFYPEMENGTTYSLVRLRTYGPMTNNGPERMMMRIDSLIYENVPGKIISQEKIFRNGYPGFDIVNKTRKGNYQRSLILITPLEVFIFKVGGTLDYLKDQNNLEDVFASFQIIENHRSIREHSNPWSNMSISLPGTPLCEKNPRSLFIDDTDEEWQALGENNTYYRVKRAGLHDKYYIEEDTFELSLIATTFQDDMHLKESKRIFGAYQGFPSIYTMCKDSTKWLHSTYVLRGPHYYQLLVHSSDSTIPVDFFNSLRFKTPEYSFPFARLDDTAFHYSVVAPLKFAGWNAPKRNRSNKKEGEEKFDGKTEYRTYHFIPADEKVYLAFEKFDRYFYIPSYDSIWKREIDRFTVKNSLALKQFRVSSDSSIAWFSFNDTGSIKSVELKMISRGDRLYTLAYPTDSLSPVPLMAQRFFESFEAADTGLGLPFFENKGELFLSDIYGDDSLATLYALKNLDEIQFKDEHAPQIMEIIETYAHDEFDVAEKISLIEALGNLKHPSVLPYLKNVYHRSIDTAQFQLAVLTALAKNKSKSSAKTIMELLEYETPLVSSNEVRWFIYSLYDSSKLYGSLLPVLMDYTRYPEYKPHVFALISHMQTKEVIRKKQLKTYKSILLREGKDNLKRAMANAHKSSRDDYYGSDNSNYEIERLLYSLNNLLLPMAGDKNVDEYFQRALRLHDDDLKIQTMSAILKNGCDVNDTLWLHFANKDASRLYVYNSLQEIERLDKMPDSTLTPEKLARAILYQDFEITEKDSLHLYRTVSAKNKQGEGNIFVFKHRKKNEDNQWQVDYVGIIGNDTLNMEFSDLEKRRNMDFYDDEELDETLKKLKENLLYKDRKRVKRQSLSSYSYY
jgi:uncharacterized protein YbaP (TraB family)